MECNICCKDPKLKAFVVKIYVVKACGDRQKLYALQGTCCKDLQSGIFEDPARPCAVGCRRSPSVDRIFGSLLLKTNGLLGWRSPRRARRCRQVGALTFSWSGWVSDSRIEEALI